jgi:hypothetical protein
MSAAIELSPETTLVVAGVSLPVPKIIDADKDNLLGKGMTEEWRKSTRAVNEECGIIEERMDALRDRVRAPLTEFENKEKDRIKGHEDALAAMIALADMLPPDATSQQVCESLDRLDLHEAGREWQEFALRASDLHVEAGARLTAMLAEALGREEEAAAAEKRRLEAEEAARQEAARLQREREARIAMEAAETARLAAERRAAEAAAAERQRVEREKQEALRIACEAAEKAEYERLKAAHAAQEAQDRAARAERARIAAEADRVEAQERAKREAARLAQEAEIKRKAMEAKAEADAAAAVAAERRRQTEEAARLKREAEAKAADRENRAVKHREIAADLTEHAGITAEQARRTTEALARGQIRNVGVQY